MFDQFHPCALWSSFGSFDFPHIIFNECQSGWCLWMKYHEVAQPIEASRRLCTVMLHSSVLVLVYSSMLVIFLGQCMPRIFPRCLLWIALTVFSSFVGESPQFAVVEEYTCNIGIEGSDFDCVADFSVSIFLFNVLKA